MGARCMRQCAQSLPTASTGFNDVGYKNYSDLTSPTIDNLALTGIRLERYYTHNLCSPSRTAFLSGRYASSVGMQGCVIINGQAIDLPKNVSGGQGRNFLYRIIATTETIHGIVHAETTIQYIYRCSHHHHHTHLPIHPSFV